MDWREARDHTLARWLAIRESIEPTVDPVDLLSRIHAVNELCRTAQETSGAHWGHCPYCPFYQQFGGCQELSGEMSERVAARNWEELDGLVGGFITHLRQLETPPPPVTPAEA